MTWQETGYGGYCALGIEWNENNSSATQFSIAPTVWRWDYYSVNPSGQKWWEDIYYEPSGSYGSWTNLSFSRGSGWRKIDTWGTRTYTKTHSTQSILIQVGTDGYFASINDGGFYSIGAKTAKFTMTIPAKTSYSVTYNANGGSGAPSSQTKWHGETLTLSSTVPTRTGYTFNGWNTKSDGSGTNYVKGASYTGNANLTLYAKWTINTWTVSYNGNGSTSGSTSSQTKTYGQTLTLRANGYTRTNYVFKNWNTKSDGSGTSYNASGSYTANAAATMYAQWYSPYTITPNANGGTLASGCSALTKPYNATNFTIWASSLNPTRSGYNFTGWNTNAAGTGTAYAAGASYTANANATLYAQWAIAHSNPTISNFSVKRCDSSGTLADDGDHCKVTATVTVDYSTTGYTDTKVNTVTVKLGSNSAETVYSKGSDTGVTSYSVSFVSANTASITSAYTVTLTVTDTKSFSASKSATLSVAFFTMHFKEGGHGIAIGKKSVIGNLFDVNMNTKVTGTLDTTGKITSLGEVEAQERIVVNANEDNYGAIRFNSENAAYDGVRFYGNDDEYGDEIVVGAGGMFIAGSGESAYNLHNALIDAGETPGNEQTYIASDNHVYLFSHCNTIENRTQLMLNNSSNVALYGRCGADHAVSIDTSANNGVTANTVIGTIEFQDKNSTWGSKFYSEAYGSGGRVQAVVAAHNKKTDGTEVTNYFTVCADKDGTQRYTISNQANFRSAIAAANQPTQLYYNTTGTDGTVTLSQTAANFNYLRIYFKKNGDTNACASTDLYSPNGKKATLIVSNVSSSIAQLTWKIVTISGKSITVSSQIYWNRDMSSGSMNGSTTDAKVYIYRVEGWK